MTFQIVSKGQMSCAVKNFHRKVTVNYACVQTTATNAVPPVKEVSYISGKKSAAPFASESLL